MLGRDVVDQLLNDDRLAYARSAEEADLAPLEEGLDQVDNFHAGLKHLLRGGLLFERGRLAMNGTHLLGGKRTKLLHREADHIEYTPQRTRPRRQGDRTAEVDHLHAAHHALGRFHRDTTHAAFAD